MTRRGFSAGVFSLGLCAGEDDGLLEGRIASENGQPVPDALIKAQHTVRQNTHTATAHRDGRYRFPALPGGSYNLYVTKRGYCSVWIRQVVVRPSQTTTRDITLAVDSACAPNQRGT